MKQFLVFLLFIILKQASFAQTYLSQTEFELGDISQLNEDVVDINLKNQLDKNLFILRIESKTRVSIKYTSKNLKVGSAQLLRIKLNPTQTGKFKEQIKLYLSSNETPILLIFKGEVKTVPRNNKTACPDFNSNQHPQTSIGLFNSQKSGQSKQYYVEIIDDIRKEHSDNKIEVKAKNPEQESELVSTVWKKKRKLTPEERRNQPSVLETLFGNIEDTANFQQNEDKEQISHLEKVSMDTTSNSRKKEDHLLSDNYSPNNIVFLIDASTSMKEEERMDLLKSAMIKLLEPLRPIDYISIVVYSGEARTLLIPTSAIEKSLIQESINKINADGSTQAVKGIKKAIQVGKSNFLKEGNNQIILATDGAFDIGRSNESLRRKIKNTAKEGLSISVIGIKNEKWTNKSLKEIVELGRGNLIRINGNKDVSKILEEIKKNSAN